MVHGVRERGEAGMRLIAGMALLAALAWTIPMVFFGREQARDEVELAGAVEDAPDAVVTGEAPIDPAGRAVDAKAQADLNESMRIALVYFAENGTYEGFGPAAAAEFSPNVGYSVSSPAPGVVSIRGVTPTEVVLVTVTERGGFLCAAAEGDLTSFGRSDAQVPGQCAGGWE